MDTPELRTELNAIVPGVVEAYEALRTSHGTGIYTSNGSFYNHTFFARDSSMSAKFILDYDHALARETILALAAMQGTEHDAKTQEEFGRIHHELRDFDQWNGSFHARLLLWPVAKLWGMKKGRLLTYFAIDTTASFIRLTHKYASHIDRSILDETFTSRSGEVLTVAESLARASDWIVSQVDDEGVLYSLRTNKWSLPFQTPEDSTTSYARTDGSLANYRRGVSYVEAQVFAADALRDMAQLLDSHSNRKMWHETMQRMESALSTKFWNSHDNYFASAVDASGQVDLRNISAGWTLNVSMWHVMSDEERAAIIGPIVTRLFSPEFLTPVGLRTRSILQKQPLAGVLEYHGSNTVWPMFNFMVVEGLRRHNLHRLAEQLQNRLINGLNASGNFDEFFMVNSKDELIRVRNNDHKAVQSLPIQMVPEQQIAFSVVPALTMAHRIWQQDAFPPQEPWQAEVESAVLAAMPQVSLVAPEDAIGAIGPVNYIRPRRPWGNIRTTIYFLKQNWRMK